MKSLLASALALTVLLGAGCLPTKNVPAENAVNFGTSVVLQTGESLIFEDELKVTLVQVNDSRCPEGVTCVWQGELSPVLELSGGSLWSRGEITLGTVTKPSDTHNNYIVTLVAATESTATISVSLKK